MEANRTSSVRLIFDWWSNLICSHKQCSSSFRTLLERWLLTSSIVSQFYFDLLGKILVEMMPIEEQEELVAAVLANDANADILSQSTIQLQITYELYYVIF